MPKQTGVLLECLRVEMMTIILTQDEMNNAKWISNRFKLICLWQAIGRTGELALSSWKTAYWDSALDNLAWMWKDEKNSKEYLMIFFPDAEGFVMDFYHALACYLVFGGGVGDYSRGMDADQVSSKTVYKYQLNRSINTNFKWVYKYQITGFINTVTLGSPKTMFKKSLRTFPDMPLMT